MQRCVVYLYARALYLCNLRFVSFTKTTVELIALCFSDEHPLPCCLYLSVCWFEQPFCTYGFQEALMLIMVA